MSISSKLLLLGIFIGGVSGSSYFLMKQFEPESIKNGRKLKESRPLGAFSLFNQNNRPFNESHLQGKWSLVTFGFTSCPDVCPSAMAAYRDEMNLLEDSLPNFQFILVTVDPERDTPDVLKDYLKNFHPQIVGLTGSLSQIEVFAKMFSVHFQKEGGGKEYTMAHSPQFFLIDPQGNWTAMYTPPFKRGNLAMDLSRISSRTTL